MDNLIHLVGLTLIPIMIYIIYLGSRDIIRGIKEKSNILWPHNIKAGMRQTYKKNINISSQHDIYFMESKISIS